MVSAREFVEANHVGGRKRESRHLRDQSIGESGNEVGEEVEEHYHKIKSEHELNLNGVKDTFNNFIFQYDTSGNPLEQTVADLGRMMNLRFRINAPRRPPRVIILGPPGSGRSTTAEIISQRFGLVNVSPM